MYPYELNPKPYCSSEQARQNYANQGRTKSSLLRNILLAGVLAFAGCNIHSCVSDTLREASIPVTAGKSESKKLVNIRIPRDCVPYFAEMKKMNVSQNLRILLAKTVYIESKFNQRAKGSAGDVGYGQLTKVNIEDTVERALNSPRSEGGRLVMPYLKRIPPKDRVNYSAHGVRGYMTRRRVVNRVYDLVKRDGRANLRFTGATLSYGNHQVANLCSRLNIPYTPDMVDAHHNAPQRTIKSLVKHKNNWRASPVLPKITAKRNKQFNRMRLLN